LDAHTGFTIVFDDVGFVLESGFGQEPLQAAVKACAEYWRTEVTVEYREVEKGNRRPLGLANARGRCHCTKATRSGQVGAACLHPP
jgi:hypothetical protein